MQIHTTCSSFLFRTCVCPISGKGVCFLRSSRTQSWWSDTSFEDRWETTRGQGPARTFLGALVVHHRDEKDFPAGLEHTVAGRHVILTVLRPQRDQRSSIPYSAFPLVPVGSPGCREGVKYHGADG